MSVTTPPAPSGRGTSAPVVRTTGPEVMGDGTTARSRAADRWRRLRIVAVIAALVVAAAVVASLLTPPRSTLPLAPDNPESSGSRAAAEILRRQGVDVVHARTFADATAASTASTAGTTLLVTSTHLLAPEQVEGLVATGADLVLVEPDWGTLTTATDDRLDTRWAERHEGTVDAQCADPDAEAAGRLAVSADGGVAAGVGGTEGVTVCFPLPDDPEAGLYAVADLGDRRVAVIADSDVMTNDRLDEEGNAALVLRALGRHADLVWYQPTFGDVGGTDDPDTGGPAAGDVLPSWAGPLALQLALVVLVVALWRGRAFGRVVTEPLPVRVRATETVLGRGRLYRRTRSRGHAAAALRAGVARRAAARLGLPRSAGAADVIDALARATGRDGRQVGALLYGPPPTDDTGLLELARQLDELESEVHRT